MNWGKGIISGMTLFMLFIVGMGIYMFAAPADDYDHQYYEKGLSFDHDLAKEQQVLKDDARPIAQVLDQFVTFTFKAPAKGNIRFIRPSDTGLDRVYELNTGQGDQITIPRVSIPNGEWHVTIDWQSNKKAYLYQQKLYIK